MGFRRQGREGTEGRGAGEVRLKREGGERGSRTVEDRPHERGRLRVGRGPAWRPQRRRLSNWKILRWTRLSLEVW